MKVKVLALTKECTARISVSNSLDPDQTPNTSASDTDPSCLKLFRNCLRIFEKKSFLLIIKIILADDNRSRMARSKSLLTGQWPAPR